MNDSYRSFFGLTHEPFTSDISCKDILVTPTVKGVQDRIMHAISIGAAALVTGEIGSGKSTALRYVMGELHPSQYRIIYVTARSMQLGTAVANKRGSPYSQFYPFSGSMPS